jgi:hypothetical protein
MEYVLHPKYSPVVVRRTQSTLSSIVVVRLLDKQEMQGPIRYKGGYPFVPFCCPSITDSRNFAVMTLAVDF